VKKQKVLIFSITLSQLRDIPVSAYLHLHGPEPAVSCRHSSVMGAAGRPHLTHYLPGILASTKLYCLVMEAHVCEQLAQSFYLVVEWPGVKPLQSLVRHCNHYITKPNKQYRQQQ